MGHLVTYVISDVHGYYDCFMDFLHCVHFPDVTRSISSATSSTAGRTASRCCRT